MKKLLTYLTILIVAAGCFDDTVLLYAFREAPIGGEFIKLKDSISFEYGPIKTKGISKGTYVIKNDSLILTYSIKHHEGVPNVFVFQKGNLVSQENKVAPLEILTNNLK